MARRIDNLAALDWDDTALIQAYNRGMSLRVKGFEKNNKAAKEKRNSKKKHEWRVGDHCRAVYQGDGDWYEAKIVSIDDDMCTVIFLGYDDEAEVELNSLDKSYGKKAIKKQKNLAKKNLVTSDLDESADGDDTRDNGNDTRNDHPIPDSPRRHHHSHSRREYHRHNDSQYHRNNESHMFDHSRNYTAAESTFHSAYPVVRYPEIPASMVPAAIPPCPEIAQNPSFNTMLTAWYMAGYYTGFHEAQKNSCQQHCCYHS